jgi:hypothetical protein
VKYQKKQLFKLIYTFVEKYNSLRKWNLHASITDTTYNIFAYIVSKFQCIIEDGGDSGLRQHRPVVPAYTILTVLQTLKKHVIQEHVMKIKNIFLFQKINWMPMPM